MDRQPRRAAGPSACGWPISSPSTSIRRRSARWPTSPAKPAPGRPGGHGLRPDRHASATPCWAGRALPDVRATRSSAAEPTIREGLAARKTALLVAVGGDDRSGPRGLPLPAAGRRGVFLRGGACRRQPKPDAGGKAPPWQEGESRHARRRAAFASPARRRSNYHLANRTVGKLRRSSSDSTTWKTIPPWSSPAGPTCWSTSSAARASRRCCWSSAGWPSTWNCTPPGSGIGGFIGTVCFLLFFWSHYLPSTAGWLEIILVRGRHRLPADGGLRGAGHRRSSDSAAAPWC